MSNQKSTESAIKNLEVQVGQLAKQLAERPSNSFTANTKKNPKEECKVVMTRSRMHKDPGVVTIPCSIGEVVVRKDLIDLGTSINLMPLSICRRLGEIQIMPTCMTLQLADRSITRPYGVIEDVLVKAKHLIFSADFVVIDIEKDADIPFILCRPFMSTASCMVDMGKKMLQMGIEDQKISFDLFYEDKRFI
ncbi:uncharacterized protein [Glycine max]|uniref:uncharacterized protein n=1 Tax=Glycine max TaxID=3847 RepID=UPI0003DE9F9A|nr:uncharacterized protein LOC102663112 [Glycine max]|eukprot:XP_006579226.1 uncharacterized protein LOC102663112 [Glycine max]